jgi:hypothetical protein
MKIKKILLYSFIGTILTCTLPMTTYAHTPPRGSETAGYIVNADKHAGVSSDSYYISNSGAMTVSTELRSYIRQGEDMWDGSPVSFYENSSSGTGRVTAHSDPNAGYAAYHRTLSTNSSGHILSWLIGVNYYNWKELDPSKKKIALAHEFGHAVGLHDLEKAENVRLMMYGKIGDDTKQYAVTSYDKKGASYCDE